MSPDPQPGSQSPLDPHDELRRRLIAVIEAEVRETRRYLGKDALDPRVIAALAKVPRHAFVPPELEPLAYENGPLPISHGQTISQPYIVAVMTDMLAPRPEDVVLEIGTGSGYQAAVLAELVRRVYSIEYVPALAEQAAERLARLGYRNVTVRAGDGTLGWAEAGPFDGIIVTAAAAEVPRALMAQLKAGRRLVMPVGAPGDYQELMVMEKSPRGDTVGRATLPVAFVPLIGGRPRGNGGSSEGP